jgi:hypothetical protein
VASRLLPIIAANTEDSLKTRRQVRVSRSATWVDLREAGAVIFSNPSGFSSLSFSLATYAS